MKIKTLNNKRELRGRRVRKKVGKGTKDIPRLSIFRSNKYIYAQVIDDVTGTTVVSASSIGAKGSKIDVSREVGKDLAKKAKKAGVIRAVFDRGSNDYHGRVKALAEGAREGGLKL